jgi:putative phage-type endonuclease
MIIHNLEQGTPEWFAVRLGKLTASDAQAIATAGKGLETLAFEKVAEIVSGTKQESYTNGDIDRGHEQEELARASYELQYGLTVVKVGFVELSEYIGASPDGFVGDDGLVEFKCPNNTNFVRIMYGKKPDSKYEWQMQMQMHVTDRKWVDFVAYNENFPEIITLRVERDEKKIEKIVAGLEEGVSQIKTILEGVK